MISNGLLVNLFRTTARTHIFGSFTKNSMQLVQLSGKNSVYNSNNFEFFSFWSNKLLNFGTMITAGFLNSFKCGQGNILRKIIS